MEKTKSLKISLLMLILLFAVSQTTFILSASLLQDSKDTQEGDLLAYSSESSITSYDAPYQNDIDELLEEKKFRKTNQEISESQITVLTASDTTALVAATAETTQQNTQAAQPTPTPTNKPKGVVRYVNANKLNVRSEPNSESKLITSISRGDKVTYYETVGEWARIITWTDKKGYVLAKYLVNSEKDVEKIVASASTTTKTSRGTQSTAAAAPLSEEGKSLAQQIVDYAKTLQGVKYVYGGYSTKGFDCSGFTKYVFAHFGITVPRSSSEYWNFGTKVSRSDIAAGDIVLFDTDGGREDVSHVGIYIGGGNFIHASSSKGKVVIMNLNSYRGKYMGARRVIK
ncbi:MAG: SH3 domain-containing protein [Clostridiaceae bacterium]|nr:SH3 domain-containing protein [Clostridiaceae bacterium]